MRGKVIIPLCNLADLRITPAYAGKRMRTTWRTINTQDHPRLCGEKRLHVDVFYFSEGSPPPMRGKARLDVFVSKKCRITPAYAGKSSSLRRLGCPWWDHPRLCGEKWKMRKNCGTTAGSPPPMRGKGRKTLRNPAG